MLQDALNKDDLTDVIVKRLTSAAGHKTMTVAELVRANPTPEEWAAIVTGLIKHKTPMLGYSMYDR